MVRRLLVTYLTVTALVLAVILVPLGRIFADREHDRLLFDLERDAQTFASLVEDHLEAGAVPDVPEVLEYAEGAGRVVVVDRTGASVADSDRPDGPPRDFSTRPEIAGALEGSRQSGTRPSATLGTDLVFVAVPVASGGVVHGAVRVTFPTSALDARVRATWLRLGALAAVVLLLVTGIGLVLGRYVTRPIRRVQDAAVRLSDGDLSARVPSTEGPPEVRELARTFNRTAERLDQLLASQRRFVADASHQLRTPLTALRLRLEALLDGVDAAARPGVEAAVAETGRLARLVDSLLVLARADAAPPGRADVDVTEVVRSRADLWRPLVEERGLVLGVTCPPGLTARAVPDALEQVLDNLLANAVDAAPPGSAVAVTARRDGDEIVVHVVDRGPGMDAEQRARAFERFWRAAPGGEGFGLGLSIVRQLVEQSGGEVRLGPGPGGIGLDVGVRLPRAAVAARPAPSAAHP